MADTLQIIKEAERLRDLKGKASKAIEMLEKLGEEIKDDPLLSYDYPMILKKIGSYHSDLGQNEQAKEYLQQALEVAKIDLNKIQIADIRCRLASLELQTGSIEKALGYALRAWNYIGKKRGDKFIKTKVHTAIVLGNIYFEQGKYPQSLEKYQVALRNAEFGDYTKGLIDASAELAKYNIIIKENFTKAEEFLQEYMDEMLKSYKMALPQFSKWLGRIYLERGDLDEAKAITKKALKFAEKNNLLRSIAEVSEFLGQIYAEKNQEIADGYFKKAFDSYNQGGYNMPTEHPKEEDWFTHFEEEDEEDEENEEENTEEHEEENDESKGEQGV
jgi:tetratricopeptide (TPR) repeat protein